MGASRPYSNWSTRRPPTGRSGTTAVMRAPLRDGVRSSGGGRGRPGPARRAARGRRGSCAPLFGPAFDHLGAGEVGQRPHVGGSLRLGHATGHEGGLGAGGGGPRRGGGGARGRGRGRG